MVVPLSVKATFPVGPEAGVTVAVNVTLLLGDVVKAGFWLEETAVDVGVVLAYVTIISHELMLIGVVSPSPFWIVSVHTSPSAMPIPVNLLARVAVSSV